MSSRQRRRRNDSRRRVQRHAVQTRSRRRHRVHFQAPINRRSARNQLTSTSAADVTRHDVGHATVLAAAAACRRRRAAAGLDAAWALFALEQAGELSHLARLLAGRQLAQQEARVLLGRHADAERRALPAAAAGRRC